jgi:hypothetical protein
MVLRTPASLISATLLATGLAACATDTPSDSVQTAGGKADGVTATITFSADWSEHASGDLLAGSAVRISYN